MYGDTYRLVEGKVLVSLCQSVMHTLHTFKIYTCFNLYLGYTNQDAVLLINWNFTIIYQF